MKLKSNTIHTSIKENKWFRGKCKELCARPVCTENHKTLLRKFSETEINGEHVPVGGLEGLACRLVLSQPPSPRAPHRNWQAGLCHLCANAKPPGGPEQPWERLKWKGFHYRFQTSWKAAVRRLRRAPSKGKGAKAAQWGKCCVEHGSPEQLDVSTQAVACARHRVNSRRIKDLSVGMASLQLHRKQGEYVLTSGGRDSWGCRKPHHRRKKEQIWLRWNVKLHSKGS